MLIYTREEVSLIASVVVDKILTKPPLCLRKCQAEVKVNHVTSTLGSLLPSTYQHLRVRSKQIRVMDLIFRIFNRNFSLIPNIP